jgi:crossover junction endodeoxyribonuclease RusA
MTRVTLPWPPGLNNLFKNLRRGRARTARYDAWIAEATAELARQRPAPVLGPFCVRLVLHRPDRRRRDLDGLAKAPLDLLVKAGVIGDDSLAQEITLAWSREPVGKPGSVVVSIEVAQ